MRIISTSHNSFAPEDGYGVEYDLAASRAVQIVFILVKKSTLLISRNTIINRPEAALS
jgi:hypothetical protein